MHLESVSRVHYKVIHRDNTCKSDGKEIYLSDKSVTLTVYSVFYFHELKCD